MARPTVSDLIFSSEQANHNFSKTLGDIKRHTLSIHNRLQSILADAAFVQRVSGAYGRPVIANERCGSWYISPALKAGSAYFKSTDGHTGVWKLSTRRLNTHLLKQIGQHDGCIIVDSTRRGKRMPDALSKTIPIWCSIINRALFPNDPEYHDLYTPPQVVSTSEHAQIAALLDDFLKSFLALDINITTLREHISKPIRPMWLTPESQITDVEQVFGDYHPVICCTASRRVAGGEVSEGGYIQGSGDDTENWACGLTPLVFWSNRELLLSTPESDLPDLIIQLASKSTDAEGNCAALTPIAPTSSLYVISLATLVAQPAEICSIVIVLSSIITDPNTWQTAPNKIEVGVGSGKIGSRNLRAGLPQIVAFVKKSLSRISSETESPVKIFMVSQGGKDLSIGVALTLLCLLYDGKGGLMEPNASPADLDIDKTYIRRRLGWIMTVMPDANPSRSTLQSVNSYLMERPS